VSCDFFAEIFLWSKLVKSEQHDSIVIIVSGAPESKNFQRKKKLHPALKKFSEKSRTPIAPRAKKIQKKKSHPAQKKFRKKFPKNPALMQNQKKNLAHWSEHFAEKRV
jgi:hypothetical protein